MFGPSGVFLVQFEVVGYHRQLWQVREVVGKMIAITQTTFFETLDRFIILATPS
jgi:hypothetical protein